MSTQLAAAMQPSSVLHVLRAALPVEPKVAFVYLLLLVVPWVIWEGHRTRGDEHQDPDPSGEAEGPSEAPRSRPKGTPGRSGTRSKRRRRGQINWIQ